MSDVDASAPDSRALLGAGLLGLMAVGLVVLASFPGARTGTSAVGWPPMWLVGLPATAWSVLQLLRLPRRRGPASSAGPRRRRPGLAAQATRRPSRRRRQGLAARAALAAAALLLH